MRSNRQALRAAAAGDRGALLALGRRLPLQRQAGIAAIDYLGAVAAIALVLAGLLVVRAHVASRNAPVRPIPVIQRLLGEPARQLHPRQPPTPGRPHRPRRPRRPRPAIVVHLPDWVTRR